MILKQLKADAMNMINIHSTVSSLRRACSVGEVSIVPESNELPKLYYVKVHDNESIHALNSDLVKFLMTKHIETAGTGDSYLINGLDVHWINTESDYNAYVDKSYRDEYSWEDSKSTMPWLVLNIDRPESEVESEVNSEVESEEPIQTDNKVKLKVTFGSNVILGKSVDKLGTVSEDRHSVEAEVNKYLMFEAINDLGLTGIESISIKAETEDAIYSVNVN